MKALIALAAVLSMCLAACDYTVPLATAPQAPADPKLNGLWQSASSEDTNQTLLILPLSKNEYLISFPSGHKDALFAKVIHASQSLVQIHWIGTAAGVVPDDPRVYQIASYDLDGQDLTIRLLNPETIGKNIKTTHQLVRAIEASKGHPAFFREPMKFKRAKPQTP